MAARLILAAAGLVALALVAPALARELRPILEGIAVLALAGVGFWLILSAPFRRWM